MLTQHAIRAELDAIAEEILALPGIYAELYSRLFTQRVRHWMAGVSYKEAQMIEETVEFDQDYLPDHFSDYLSDAEPATLSEFASDRIPQSGPLFNPAWDVQY